uniref:Uncharacterized protein n=1 Tax=Rhizophagus irregularis (strain DAOM 181602 / DAOM 197198 / MUCL 43194) TaxID=747089 RepID=U9T7P2_RHIID
MISSEECDKISRITLRNGISLGDGITDVKLVKNANYAIITHIYTAKGVKKEQKEYISGVIV